MPKPSDLEAEFGRQIRRFELPQPIMEHCFALDLLTKRRWRLDFAWIEFKVAVELHGLVDTGRGGHQTIPGLKRDMDKRNAAILLGWDVLTFTQSHLASDWAINVTQRALAVKGWKRG